MTGRLWLDPEIPSVARFRALATAENISATDFKIRINASTVFWYRTFNKLDNLKVELSHK